MMTKCIVLPGNTYRGPMGNHGAGETVHLPMEEAIRLKAEGVLHFEDPPKPSKRIEVKEEK